MGIAHRAFGAARDSIKGGLVDLDLFLFGHVGEVFGNEGSRDAPQVEALAAGKDGRQDLLGVGCREHKLHVLRRLFEGLEQGIERRSREHVNFVNDVDLKPGGGRSVSAGLPQLADLLDAIIAGAVDFENVQRPALGDFLAARVGVVEIHFRSAGAIEAFGKNAGDGGFASAARAAKEVGVSNALALDGLGEGLSDVFLPHNLGEALRAILPGYDLIGHSLGGW